MKRFLSSCPRLPRGSHGASAVRLCCSMSVPRRTQRIRLFVGFLAMLVAAGLLFSAGTAQAELISINIGPTGFNIGGINAGIANGNSNVASSFPISGNTLFLYNEEVYNPPSDVLTGLEGMGLTFAAGATPATPVNFSLNASIGSGPTYRSGAESLFKFSPSVSPEFGAGSYMGFKTAQNNYGWLEVTWKPSTSRFQILSGAYESTPNVAVLAGAAAVPEPSTCVMALAGLACGGYSMFRRRRVR